MYDNSHDPLKHANCEGWQSDPLTLLHACTCAGCGEPHRSPQGTWRGGVPHLWRLQVRNRKLDLAQLNCGVLTQSAHVLFTCCREGNTKKLRSRSLVNARAIMASHAYVYLRVVYMVGLAGKSPYNSQPLLLCNPCCIIYWCDKPSISCSICPTPLSDLCQCKNVLCREMALPIASHLKIPAKNVFCNTMSWKLDDQGEPIRLQVGSPKHL